MQYKIKPSPSQIRAARGLLNWQQADLAELCGLSRASIAQIELGNTQATHTNLEKITSVFWDAGIEFTEGEGLRRRVDIIEILEGDDGVRKFFDDIYFVAATKGGEFLVSGVNEKEFIAARERLNIPHRERMSKLPNIKYKILISEDDTNQNPAPYAQYRKIPTDKFVAVPFYIYGDKTAIIHWKPKPRFLIIKDAQTTHAYRQQFEMIWEQSKTT